jgi:hypothetical protein
MDVYRRETREAIRRFLLHQLSFPKCIAALDASLASLMLRMRREDLGALRVLILSNNEIVMKEMERRARSTPSPLKLG